MSYSKVERPETMAEYSEETWAEFRKYYHETELTLRKIASKLKIKYSVAMSYVRRNKLPKRKNTSLSTASGLDSGERKVLRVHKTLESTKKFHTLNGQRVPATLLDAVPEEGIPDIGVALNIDWINALKNFAQRDASDKKKNAWLPPGGAEEEVVMALTISDVEPSRIRDIVAPGMDMEAFEKRHTTILKHGLSIAAAKMSAVLYAQGLAGNSDLIKFFLTHRAGWSSKHKVEHVNEVTVVDYRRGFDMEPQHVEGQLLTQDGEVVANDG